LAWRRTGRLPSIPLPLPYTPSPPFPWFLRFYLVWFWFACGRLHDATGAACVLAAAWRSPDMPAATHQLRRIAATNSGGDLHTYARFMPCCLRDGTLCCLPLGAGRPPDTFVLQPTGRVTAFACRWRSACVHRQQRSRSGWCRILPNGQPLFYHLAWNAGRLRRAARFGFASWQPFCGGAACRVSLGRLFSALRHRGAPLYVLPSPSVPFRGQTRRTWAGRKGVVVSISLVLADRV